MLKPALLLAMLCAFIYGLCTGFYGRTDIGGMKAMDRETVRAMLRRGEISLGRCAELLGVTRQELRDMILFDPDRWLPPTYNEDDE